MIMFTSSQYLAEVRILSQGGVTLSPAEPWTSVGAVVWVAAPA